MVTIFSQSHVKHAKCAVKTRVLKTSTIVDIAMKFHGSIKCLRKIYVWSGEKKHFVFGSVKEND